MMSFFSMFAKSASELSGPEFKKQYETAKNGVLLDVRTPGEFKGGALPGAKNLDFFASNFKSELAKLSKDKVYFVYCRSGARSGQAVKLLNKMGYSAFNLQGGMGKWPR
jgi:rhodanese-related sulfurtransferase